ncbi:DUF2922 domain-containing protein [Salicibibacter halophilus]|uniref:DUF2922 domain-containing protein n=1 Tax=Salicibibacter halophilus TaxID=2502791 RepID=A0A514LLN0_9BACI|nr:DUF2922 domain-containing protein [Salicibibacter halophilus]QDI92703.1 DUF2922 domain-containing protein [Salicibibacter halophilus]
MNVELQMRFRNEEGRMSSISVNNPAEELESSQLEEAMDQILDHDVFFTSGGPLVEKVDARLVSRSVEQMYEA